AADRAHPGDHAAHLSRRELLLLEHAAALLAEGHLVQSGSVPDQRVSLEFLRYRRRGRRPQPGLYLGVLVLVSWAGGVDFQDGVPHSGMSAANEKKLPEWRPDAAQLPLFERGTVLVPVRSRGRGGVLLPWRAARPRPGQCVRDRRFPRRAQ